MPSGRIVADIDYYLPIFAIFRLIIFVGILRVGEQIMNPLGSDDDDFEINLLIDRSMKVSFPLLLFFTYLICSLKASIFSCTQLASKGSIPCLDTVIVTNTDKTDFPYTEVRYFLHSLISSNLQFHSTDHIG